MWRIILREILVLLAGLALFPAAVIVLLVLTDQLTVGLAYFARAIFSAGSGTFVHETPLWIKWISPYLAVQALRGYLWHQRSVAGRRWANLYFSLLLLFIGLWAFERVWDLFYFMYALGDIPDELPQLVEIEGTDLLVAVCSLWLTVHCFRIFLNPEGKPRGPKTNP